MRGLAREDALADRRRQNRSPMTRTESGKGESIAIYLLSKAITFVRLKLETLVLAPGKALCPSYQQALSILGRGNEQDVCFV